MTKSDKCRTMTGGQAAIESLQHESVSHVFGLIGSATMEMFDALYEASDIAFIGVHDERTGTHMADGFARASGKSGVILAGQNGPGATNLVTGLAQAKAAFSPVISLAGALSTAHHYKDAFQEVDQEALFRPVTKQTWNVPSTERVQDILTDAFRVAHAPRKGPVHVNLPRDVLAGQAEYRPLPPVSAYRGPSAAAPAQDALRQAAHMLRHAKRPVIIAGGGIKNERAEKAALGLASAFHCPIVTSPGHGDALGFGHPLNAGQMGPRGNEVASRLVRQADVILALGTRLGFNSTFFSYDNINEEADIIHIEQEPTAIGRYFPVALGIVADAPSAAIMLTDLIENQAQKDEAKAWTDAYLAERQAFLAKRDESALSLAEAELIQPAALYHTLRGCLPENAAITMDAGTLCLQATDNLNYHQAGSLFTPLDFGLVGFSFACGLGVKLANPERPVISLMGDGGFGMTVSELSCAVDHGINTVTIVMNNQCWGAEKAYQRDFFGERYIGANISSPPFDKLAELYGAVGYRATSLSQVSEAVSAALGQDKPCVIDVSVDPAALYSFRRDSFAHRAKLG
ncbi:MAG: thiamine pyrophosphate-binding protein [Candidatus Puniceispirillaceae bacterium]